VSRRVIRASRGSKILDENRVRPHKIRYYLERRDDEFERKMAEVLHVYREVALLRKAREEGTDAENEWVAVLSYDE
jgi:hypothetical protein